MYSHSKKKKILKSEIPIWQTETKWGQAISIYKEIMWFDEVSSLPLDQASAIFYSFMVAVVVLSFPSELVQKESFHTHILNVFHFSLGNEAVMKPWFISQPIPGVSACHATFISDDPVLSCICLTDEFDRKSEVMTPKSLHYF